jgi:hypothetical protein
MSETREAALTQASADLDRIGAWMNRRERAVRDLQTAQTVAVIGMLVAAVLIIVAYL